MRIVRVKKVIALLLFLALIIGWHYFFQAPQESERFARFQPTVEKRRVREVSDKAPSSGNIPAPVKTKPKAQVIKKVAPVESPSQARFNFLCRQFLENYLGDNDLLVDPKSQFYQSTHDMLIRISKIRTHYMNLLNETKSLESKDVCAVDEMEKYLSTLMESLKYHRLSIEMKRKFVVSIFNISTLFTNNVHEGFSLFMMYKLIENQLIGNEFIPEISRLQRDHNVYMEMKYGKQSQDDISAEKSRLKSDINALTLLMIRTLF